MATKVVLASTSIYRKQLLAQLGMEFEVASPPVDERALQSRFTGPEDELAEHLAVAKAESLRKLYPEAAIIGSDQVLILDGVILNKPSSLEEVKERLQRLQGKTHRLVTGLCLSTPEKLYRTTVEASMTMYGMSPSEVAAYAALDQAIGCAGGYKIECGGPLLFKTIETPDHHSIIGLPLLSLVAFLRQAHILGL